MQVRCSMDEPIQLLVDKLASKSSDLYIFWVSLYQYSKITISSIMPLMKKWPRSIDSSLKIKHFAKRRLHLRLSLRHQKKVFSRKGFSLWKKAKKTSRYK